MNKKNYKGVSLITLVLTIVVMIILTAIALRGTNNTTSQAGLARFVSDFSDFSQAVSVDFLNRKSDFLVDGNPKKDNVIYYIMASNNQNAEEAVPTGKVADLNLNLNPTALQGTDYYEITNLKNINGWDSDTLYGVLNGDKCYITDKGEVFVLPGYKMQEDNKRYINEKKFYTVEDESGT